MIKIASLMILAAVKLHKHNPAQACVLLFQRAYSATSFTSVPEDLHSRTFIVIMHACARVCVLVCAYTHTCTCPCAHIALSHLHNLKVSSKSSSMRWLLSLENCFSWTPQMLLAVSSFNVWEVIGCVCVNMCVHRSGGCHLASSSVVLSLLLNQVG